MGCGAEAGMGLTAAAAARRRSEGDTLKYFVEDPGTGTLYKRGQLLGQVTRLRPEGCAGLRAVAALPRVAPDSRQGDRSGGREAHRVLSAFCPATAAGKGRRGGRAGQPPVSSFKSRGDERAKVTGGSPETDWSRSAPPLARPAFPARPGSPERHVLLAIAAAAAGPGGLLASLSPL